jgi:hypothetical protein
MKGRLKHSMKTIWGKRTRNFEEKQQNINNAMVPFQTTHDHDGLAGVTSYWLHRLTWEQTGIFAFQAQLNLSIFPAFTYTTCVHDVYGA